MYGLFDGNRFFEYEGSAPGLEVLPSAGAADDDQRDRVPDGAVLSRSGTQPLRSGRNR